MEDFMSAYDPKRTSLRSRRIIHEPLPAPSRGLSSTKRLFDDAFRWDAL